MNKRARSGRSAVPRVVLDTNVTISALLFGGVPGEVLVDARRGAVRVVLGPELRGELFRILGEKFHWPDQRLEDLQDDLDDWVEWVEPETRLSVFRGSDEPDNRVLETALAGNADAIVTGDRRLLALRRYRRIPILTPRTFLDRHERRRVT